jgi:probable addiction module antidote protein
MKKKAPLYHDDVVVEMIKKNDKFAMEYISAAFNSDSETWFEEVMIAIGHFMKARGMNPSVLSHKISRDTLYKVFSQHKNPTLKTFKVILDKMGVQVQFKRKAQ